MKTKKGFIQTALLLKIIVTILVFFGLRYFGVQRYQNYEFEKLEQKRISQEKEKKAQIVVEAQQQALEQAQAEIEKLKTVNEATQRKQETLEKTLKNEAQKPKSVSISASEINFYLTGITEITCKDSSGSASLWTIDSNQVVITNSHVVETPFYSTFKQQLYCVVWIIDINGDFSASYAIFPSSKWQWNPETDIAVMKLVEHFSPNEKPYPKELEKPTSQLNYAISSLKKCPVQVPVGSPVAIIGYPAFGMQSAYGGHGSSDARIVSDGIVSGYDKTVTPPLGPLPYPNYFVSAKIDSGNSGGIAISKTETGLCVLGIPTWLNVGNYDTQGLIQNIHNVMFKN